MPSAFTSRQPSSDFIVIVSDCPISSPSLPIRVILRVCIEIMGKWGSSPQEHGVDMNVSFVWIFIKACYSYVEKPKSKEKFPFSVSGHACVKNWEGVNSILSIIRNLGQKNLESGFAF